jgi:hypothetical protein
MEDNNQNQNQNNSGFVQNQNYYDPNQQFQADQNFQNQNFQQQNFQPAQSNQEVPYGPRHIGLFILFAKTFLGLAGGTFGSLVLLLIFLASSSILQPVLSTAAKTGEQISPVFIVILMAMIFATSLISSLVSPLLLSYTEKQRYPRITTALYQIFILNLVIFAFTAPIYLTTSTTSLEFTAYAAGLQIVLVATASSLIMEILNDERYPLMAVYTTIIGILVATAANLFIFQLLKSTTVLLFAALPITWASIGFFQATLTMIYYWYYINWGNDFLASTSSYGNEYANVAQEEEEAEEQLPDDKNGGDFFKS